MRTIEEVKQAFTPVTNMTKEQAAAIGVLQSGFTRLAETLVDIVPSTADRTAALRKLLEAKWTCIQAITHSWETGTAKTA